LPQSLINQVVIGSLADGDTANKIVNAVNKASLPYPKVKAVIKAKYGSKNYRLSRYMFIFNMMVYTLS